MVFGAVAVPITVLVGMKGSEYWITGVETGAIFGGIAAGVWYFVTSQGLIVGAIDDAESIIKQAVCWLI